MTKDDAVARLTKLAQDAEAKGLPKEDSPDFLAKLCKPNPTIVKDDKVWEFDENKWEWIQK